LADDRLKTYEFWDRMAARMVDAQANSIARRLRSLAGLPFQGRADWATRMLDEISRLYLLSESYERMDALPVETQHDVRALIGWSYKQEELLPLPAVRDRWFVLGQHIEVEERLNMRRVWLHGTRTGRKAMLLDFAHGNVSFEGNYPIGHAFEAELIYYPGTYPQRALLKARRGSMSAALNEFNGFREDMEAALGDYAEALACNPWIDRFPIGLRAVVPFQAEGQCYVRDGVGRCLPVVVQTGNWWIVLSASACHPIPVFGEWDGYDLHLRTLHTDGMYFTI
jgi:hypothetical protein